MTAIGVILDVVYGLKEVIQKLGKADEFSLLDALMPLLLEVAGNNTILNDEQAKQVSRSTISLLHRAGLIETHSMAGARIGVPPADATSKGES